VDSTYVGVITDHMVFFLYTHCCISPHVIILSSPIGTISFRARLQGLSFIMQDSIIKTHVANIRWVYCQFRHVVCEWVWEVVFFSIYAVMVKW